RSSRRSRRGADARLRAEGARRRGGAAGASCGDRADRHRRGAGLRVGRLRARERFRRGLGVGEPRLMYPFGTLPENLVAFSEFLRRRYAFRIGPRETRDAARALELVDLTDERAVRNVLRPILSGTVSEATGFDRAFA